MTAAGVTRSAGAPGNGRVLAVTGGSRGIGAAIVRAAAAAGYAVCFSYARDRAAADALVAELAGAGLRVCAVQGDVADASAAGDLFTEAERRFGPAAFAVCNAGITGGIGCFADLSEAALRRTIDVNLVGTLLTAREAVRRWQAAGTAGRLVLISSVAATTGAPGEYVHYAATKAAIDAFAVGLGKEVAQAGIRVNAVAPGTADTDIHATGGDPDRPRRMAPRIPLGRVARPDEIAGAVLWLLSDEASYVTATVLRVGGGA